MKKILPILLICALLLCAACKADAPNGPTGTPDTSATEPQDETTGAADPTDADVTDTDAGESESETESEAEEISADGTPAVLTLAWAEETGLPEVYEICTAVEDPQTKIVLTADKAVTDLQVLSLYDAAIDDDGNVSFAHETLFTLDTLTPEKPLVIETTFYGDMPNIGISYIDADGSFHRYAVNVSGMDGSLFFMDFVSGGTA